MMTCEMRGVAFSAGIDVGSWNKPFKEAGLSTANCKALP